MKNKGMEIYQKANEISLEVAQVVFDKVTQLDQREERGVALVAVMAQLAGRLMISIEKTYGVPHEVLMQGIRLEYECAEQNLKSFNIGLN